MKCDVHGIENCNSPSCAIWKDRFAGISWKYPEMKDGIPTKYSWVVYGVNNLKLGYKTDIGAFTYINAKFGVVIEDYVQIGPHCSIITDSSIDNKSGPIIFKEGCKIGGHSLIMPNTIIGRNSIVGAFSFVNSNVPDNKLAYGIPIKIIGE